MSKQAIVATAPNKDHAEIVKMLSYMRPSWSKAEVAFIDRFIAPTGAKPDDFGNYWLRVGTSKIIWSSHTDTVHSQSGRQIIDVVDNKARVTASDCLGADCAAGVWIMLEMIRARVPGLYLFHRSEERGGQGSSFIATTYPDVLALYDYAIAFDRRKCASVITHQMGVRCASEAFSRSIAPMLPGSYGSDSGGSFTDTANYTHVISECTNLSVGYVNEHSPLETLDLAHLVRLRDAMVMFDESRLVAERDPNVKEYEARDWLNYRDVKKAEPFSDYSALLDFCRSCPDAIADFLDANGFTIRDLEDWRPF